MAPRPPRLIGVDFAERLQSAFAADHKAYNRQAVAKQLGLRWQTVDEWTKGSFPTEENLKRLAEAWKVSVDELLGVAAGQDPPFESWHRFLESEDGRTVSADERKSLQSIRWLPGTAPAVSDYQMALRILRAAGPR